MFIFAVRIIQKLGGKNSETPHSTEVSDIKKAAPKGTAFNI